MSVIFRKIAELAHEADAAGNTGLADKLDATLEKAALDITEPVTWSDEVANQGLPVPAAAPTSQPAPPAKKSISDHHKEISKMLNQLDPSLPASMSGSKLRTELQRLVGINTAEPGMTWGKIYRAIRNVPTTTIPARDDSPATPKAHDTNLGDKPWEDMNQHTYPPAVKRPAPPPKL